MRFAFENPTMDELRARRDEGIQYLDVHHPDWRQKVKPETLNINSINDCVLAQVSGGDYFDALREYGLTYKQVVAYGFEANGTEDSDEVHPMLDEVWKEVLAA